MHPPDDSALPTIREVLALPESVAGDPLVLAGEAALDARVRWVHVGAGEGLAHLLDGNELILTTGAGWPDEPTALVASLIDAGVAGLAIELGARFARVPDAVVATCAARGVPLIAFRREARFVQITERVHRRILAAQSEALQARTSVHAMLTELGLNRSPVDYVIEQLAATLAAPVVLENSAGEVVAWSTPHAGEDAEDALGAWPLAGGGAGPLPEGWERVPVEARGTRWGHLTALPGPAHPAGRRTVLELGAFALALGRLADSDSDEWLRLSAKRLVETLLSGRYRRDTDVAMQLTAAGLPVRGRTLIGATLRGVGPFGSHDGLEWALLETALRRAVAPRGRAIIARDTDAGGEDTLLAMLSFAPGDPRAEGPAGATAPPLAAQLARELDMLLPITVPPAWRAHLALGVPGEGVTGLLTSLERVHAAGRLGAAEPVGRVRVQQAQRQPLAHLIRGFAGSPALHDFVRETLGPLTDHDEQRDGDLIRVLGSYLEHPTNRSLAAQSANLSRSVFYQRLALIEELLGTDLAGGTTIATLRVALMALSPP